MNSESFLIFCVDDYSFQSSPGTMLPSNLLWQGCCTYPGRNRRYHQVSQVTPAVSGDCNCSSCSFSKNGGEFSDSENRLLHKFLGPKRHYHIRNFS